MAGYWMKITNGKLIPINDHAGDFMSDAKLAKQMGLTKLKKDLIKSGIEYSDKTGPIREKIVMEIMKRGWMRIREHGVQVTFEFADSLSNTASKALDAVYEFGMDYLGDFSFVTIVHLSNDKKIKDSYAIQFSKFKEMYEEDKSKILKTAKRKKK